MERTHRVSLHQQATAATEDAHGRPAGPRWGAAVATDVECNLQPAGGDVRQAAYGREIDADWQGFFPPDTDVRTDMLIVVSAVRSGTTWITPPASHPTSFRIRHLGYQGEGWDTEALLGSTMETPS